MSAFNFDPRSLLVFLKDPEIFYYSHSLKALASAVIVNKPCHIDSYKLAHPEDVTFISDKRYLRSSSELASHELLDTISKKLEYKDCFMAYKAFPWADDINLIKKSVFGISSDAFDLFDNKFRLLAILSEGSTLLRGLAMQSSIMLDRQYFLRSETKNDFRKTVYRSKHSSGGRGVANDFSSLKPLSHLVFSRENFLAGYFPISQTSCVFAKDELLIYPPCQQIFHPENEFAFVGSSYGNLSQDVVDMATQYTIDMSKLMADFGYKGHVNFDFLVEPENNKFIICEINPRLNYSLILFAKKSYDQGSDELHPLSLQALAFSGQSRNNGIKFSDFFNMKDAIMQHYTNDNVTTKVGDKDIFMYPTT